MDLQNGTTVLLVQDAQRAKAFYADLLGFHVVVEFGGTNIVFREGFALWQPDPEQVIPTLLGARSIHNTNAVPRFELCFETEELDRIHASLKAHGVRFLHEIREEVWGQRSVRFYDPDGHLIEVGESMPLFVNRFSEQGLTVEQVAERTFMPIEMVRQILGN